MFWLAMWYLVYQLVGRDVLIPSPFVVMARMFELAHDTSFWIDTLHSVLRIGLGLGIALIVGLLGGALSSVSSMIHRLTKPLLSIVTSTPVVSFIIITLVWFPSSQVVIFITFLMCVPIIWNNTLKGVRGTDIDLVEMSKFYRVSRSKRLKWLYLPSLMPYLSAAMSSVFGLAWKVGVAAEVLSHPKWGIGTQLYRSKINLDSESLFAWTAVVVILSIVFERLLGKFFVHNLDRRNAETAVLSVPLAPEQPSPLHVVPDLIRNHVSESRVVSCEVRNLTFSYAERSIFENLSETFEGNLVHCFIGPSGSGKTTLLRILSGLLDSDEGEIVWYPKPPQSRGYIFQEDRLLPWATVRENLAYVLPVTSFSDQREENAFIDSLLHVMKLDGFFDAYPSALSGGMRQRVNIARALVVRPSVIFLDEAFKGLDRELKLELIQFMSSYVKLTHAIVFMATHDVSEAASFPFCIHKLEESTLRRLDF